MFWISSNPALSHQRTWHVGTIKELRGDKTGTVLSKYKVTLCTGRQLGGAWGCNTHEGDQPPSRNVCKSCYAKLQKTKPAEAH